jgi:hypothetical protein
VQMRDRLWRAEEIKRVWCELPAPGARFVWANPSGLEI